MKKTFTYMVSTLVASMTLSSPAVQASTEGVDAAAAYPSKPITLIVPFPAANVSDIVSRLVAEEAGKVLGQNIVVDNKPGASGTIGLATAVRSAPDGYTWVVGTAGNMITAPMTQPNLSFDPMTDLTAVTMTAPLPMVVVARPGFPANTMSELVAYARENPEKVDYASLGVGSFPHLAGQLLKGQADIDLLHVPYQGSAQASTDLLGGRVGIMFDTVPPALTQIRAGKLKALAITSAEPSIVASGIPPISTTEGLENYEAISWTGLFVPAETPKAIVNKIHAAVEKALANPDIQERFLDIGVELKSSSSPEEFGAFIAAENEKWKGIAEQAELTQ